MSWFREGEACISIVAFLLGSCVKARGASAPLSKAGNTSTQIFPCDLIKISLTRLMYNHKEMVPAPEIKTCNLIVHLVQLRLKITKVGFHI